MVARGTVVFAEIPRPEFNSRSWPLSDFMYTKEEGVKYCRVTLNEVSRSFAITIPLVDSELRDKITIGYIVARVLDTLEDSSIPSHIKEKLMDEWIEIISLKDTKNVYERLKNLVNSSLSYVKEVAYANLLKNVYLVYLAVTSLDNHSLFTQYKWFYKMKEGMKKYLVKRIFSFNDYEEYAYYVAGTVGGFLTDLILEGTDDERKKEILKSTYKDFGLFLQKVNIIRDFREDVRESRYFWPQEIINPFNYEDFFKEENINEAIKRLNLLIEDAKKHIKPSLLYIENIPENFKGYKMFALVNFEMALKTLEKLENNPNVFLSDKPVKISREELEEILLKAREKIK